MPPIEHISDTARWIATYRAMESERPDAIFHDPHARRLGGARGEEIVRTLPGGRASAWALVVRTAVFDEIVREARRAVHAVRRVGERDHARPRGGHDSPLRGPGGARKMARPGLTISIGQGVMTATSEFFSGQGLKSANPLQPWGYSRLVVGGARLVCGGVLVALMIPDLRYLLRHLPNGPITLADAVDGTRIVIGALVALGGIATINAGIGGVTRLTVPPKAPAELSGTDVDDALVRRELSAYHAPRGGGYWLLRRWFPHQFPMLTAPMRAVVNDGVAEIGRAVRLVLALAAFFTTIALAPGVTAGLFGGLHPSAPVLFPLLYVAGAALHAWLAVRALPAAAPKAEVREFQMVVRGGGDPSQLDDALERELAAIRPADGMPNRLAVQGFVMPRVSIGDTGRLEGRLLVESQPELVPVPESGHVYALLAAGSALQVFALAWWLAALRPPEPLFDDGTMALFTTFLYGAQLAAGAMLSRLGGRMVAAAAETLRVFRFESVAVVLDVKASVSRSWARVGEAVHDSLARERPAVRSDVSITGRCTALLTESREPMGPRQVVGMAVTERASAVESLVRGVAERFERQPAPAVGLALPERKAAEKPAPAVDVYPRADTPRPAARLHTPATVTRFGPPLTTFAPPEAEVSRAQPVRADLRVEEPYYAPPTSPGDTRLCPECAETIKAAALRCRFCGYRFAGQPRA